MYQIHTINTFAIDNEFEIVEFYNDIGHSGKTDERPSLKKMLQDLKKGKHKNIDALLIYSIDRFSRDLGSGISMIIEISEYIENVYFIVENMVTSKEYFRVTFPLFVAIAQEERDRIIRKTSDGRSYKIHIKKKFNGNHSPIGFTKIKEELVPATRVNTNNIQSWQEVIILEFIFYSFLFGMSLRDIAKVINTKFGKTKRDADWNYKSIQYILSNHAYIGILNGNLNKTERYYYETEHINKMIDPLIFEIVQTKLKLQKAGRKKKDIISLPKFILCRSCLELLNINSEVVYCSSCKYEIVKKQIEDKLYKEIIELIKQNYKEYNINESIIKEVLERLTIMEIKLKRRIMELLTRKDEIIKTQNNTNTISKMINANSQELVKSEIELKKVKSSIHFLKNFDEPLDISIMKSTHIIKLPYIVLLDNKIKKIEIVFHNNLLNESLFDL